MFDTDTDDLVLDFDTAAAPPPEDYAPIPEGIYQARITKTEVKPTRDETGKRLVVHFRVTGPTHTGRVIIRGFNVINKNPKAQEISRRELAQLLAAIDLVGERDMGQLVDRECDIAVVVKPEQNGYPASNDVKRFSPSSNASPAPSKGPAPAKKAPAFMR
jgi:hypothetical protein